MDERFMSYGGFYFRMLFLVRICCSCYLLLFRVSQDVSLLLVCSRLLPFSCRVPVRMGELC